MSKQISLVEIDRYSEGFAPYHCSENLLGTQAALRKCMEWWYQAHSDSDCESDGEDECPWKHRRRA
eukprot:1927256-Prymnesium_polylepis.3